MGIEAILNDLALSELALFAGAGGGILGGQLMGFRTACAVETDTYCRSVLLARQRDGMLPIFPVWDDVCTFDGKPWRGSIDVVTGGFPCQDISAAGKGAGLSGERSGLVFEMLRIIEEVQPHFVFAENSPLLRTRGLGAILKELDRLGYDARWCVLGAWHIGAPHRRNRMWILAHSKRELIRYKQGRCSRENRERTPKFADNGENRGVAGSNMSRQEGKNWSNPRQKCKRWTDINSSSWWDIEPQLGRVADGVAHRMDRLKAIGNGQVPGVAALAWDILSGGLI